MSLFGASLLHVDAPAAAVGVVGVVDDIVTCRVRCFVCRNNLVKNAFQRFSMKRRESSEMTSLVLVLRSVTRKILIFYSR